MEWSNETDLPALQLVMCGSHSFEKAVSISFVSSRLSFCFMFRSPCPHRPHSP